MRCWPWVGEIDEFPRWCRRCGCEAALPDSVTRRLAHEPLGWRSTTLLTTIRRCRRTGCGHVSRPDTNRAAGEAARGAAMGALDRIVCQHLTVARARRLARRRVEHRERRGADRERAFIDLRTTASKWLLWTGSPVSRPLPARTSNRSPSEKTVNAEPLTMPVVGA
jgi:hypothetical protein